MGRLFLFDAVERVAGGTQVSAVIRRVRAEDADAIARIYDPIVRHTAISFELEPPAAPEMEQRIRAIEGFGAWLVCELGSQIAGYAYTGPFRARPAYAWSCESAIYVDAACRRRGVAAALYAALIAVAKLQGFRLMVAGITLPNAASVRLHEMCGFRQAGFFPACGQKFGHWHNVGFWSMELSPAVEPVLPPTRPIEVVAQSPEFASALAAPTRRIRA